MKKIAIVYWSGTGNTEAMANAVLEGVQAEGAEGVLYTAADFTPALLEGFDRENRKAAEQTDVYALGLMMYWAANGCRTTTMVRRRPACRPNGSSPASAEPTS